MNWHLRLWNIAWGALTLLGSTVVAQGGDWPQILGPQRTGVAVGEKLTDSIPAQGPTVVWEHKVGEGFAGVAVADDIAVVFHRRGDEDLAEGLDARTGKPLWSKSFPATYAGGYSNDHGPRCVPLIHDHVVYLFGATGDLRALDLKTGNVRWSRTAGRDYDAPDGFFGVGSTPIVEGNKLLVNVGGKKKGTGIVAFHLADGKTAWTATDEQASYSAPQAVTVDGVRHVIFVTRLAAVSVDPEQGTVRWRFRYGDAGPTVNAATPQVFNGHLFLSASYGIGAVCRKIGKTSTEEVWANNDTMSSQYSTAVPADGHFFGIDGRQDRPPGRLRCFDVLTGKIHWTAADYPIGNLIVADGKLVVVTDDGELILARASADSYRELGRAPLSRNTTRALPALANGLLYVRDTTRLKCVDLRPAK
ncbi:MAG: PQQ-binding-like beta-propeller repeat protein [Planctomycetes bacterium]|nr:PQQ-binding-like beta-propeller repeat protein [Planctomycetota bacterium]